MKITYKVLYLRTRSYYKTDWQDGGTFESYEDAQAAAKKIRARYAYTPVSIRIKEIY